MMSPNKSEQITVDKCDAGPLIFNVNKNGKPDWSNQWSKYVKVYTPDLCLIISPEWRPFIGPDPSRHCALIG